jgi:LPS export ABC transporter protein LptC
MALRIEYILLLSLIILSIFIFTEKPKSVKAIESNSSKEIYFKNFSLLEIDKSGIKNQLVAQEATKDKNSFYLVDINITHQKHHNLMAKKAVYVKDFIYLKGDVLLKRSDGFSFLTNDLNYRIKDKIAYTNKGFVMDINRSKISGRDLKYNLNTKDISAKRINALIEY